MMPEHEQDELSSQLESERAERKTRDAKLLKLAEARKALDVEYELKCAAITAETFALLNRMDGIGAKLSDLKAFWCETWTEIHKERCDFDHKKHTAQLKTWLSKGWSVEVIQSKMFDYMARQDGIYFKERHPFTLFIAGWNTWRGIPADHLNGDHSAALTSEKMRGLRGE